MFGYPLRTPSIDLVEIGSGGGSIAWVDSREIVHPDHLNSGKELSGWGRKSHLRHTNSILNYGIELEILKKNPFAKVKCATPIGQEWHYFTPEEFQRILSKTCDLRVRCLYRSKPSLSGQCRPGGQKKFRSGRRARMTTLLVCD